MKKSKQIAAIVSLIAILALIIVFVISAFTTTPATRNIFFALYFGIIAIPILVWIIIFCIGRMKGKHTIAELFPESKVPNKESENQEK